MFKYKILPVYGLKLRYGLQITSSDGVIFLLYNYYDRV